MKVFILIFLLFILLSSCYSTDKTEQPDILYVKEKYELQWMSIEGITGVGIGENKSGPCIKIYVKEKTEAIQKKIPNTIDAYSLEIVETGEINIMQNFK